MDDIPDIQTPEGAIQYAAEGYEGQIFIDIDPNAPHDEECGFWSGFSCVCKPEMREALERSHCNDCDFIHGSGYNRCNCLGKCHCGEPDCMNSPNDEVWDWGI